LAAIAAITTRGRAAIVCGGTGLYLRALLRGLFQGPAAVPAVRARLRALEATEGPGTLHRRLAAADPATAARLHPRDLLRIVRALEVLEVTGVPISAWQDAHRFRDDSLDARVIGCARGREELAARIETRCHAMLTAGLLDEIRGLWTRGWGPDLAPLRSVGYRELGAHVAGSCDLPTAMDAFARATRRLAKRQRTWFRAEPDVAWFHPDRERDALLAHAIAFYDRPWPSRTSISSSPSPR